MKQPIILFLLDYPDLGGGETSFVALMRAMQNLARPGPPAFRPVVVVPEEGRLTEALRALGVEVRCIAYPRRLRRGPLPWSNPLALWRIDRLVSRLSPAIIHAHNFFGMLYAGLPAQRRGIPLVWTCHGWFDLDTPFKRRVAAFFPAHVACVSEAVADEARRVLRGRPAISTDYLGIEPFEPGLADEARAVAASEADPGVRSSLRASVRREFGIGENVPLLAVVGRFQPIKGHALLLAALPEIRRRLPDLQVWFVGDALFGGEEEQHKRLLRERVEAEGLADCVRFLGFRTDARRLLRAFDALVIPSARESFSMAAVEGLEAGVPVVGPDGWGPREIIAAPATGLRFEPGNPGDVARKVIEAVTKQGAGAGFDPQSGPARVAELFTAQAHAHRTLALYRTLAPQAF